MKVKEKGRTVLPVELQKACGFKPGDTLIVQEISQGRFTVETRERKIQSLWEKALTSNESPATKGLLRTRSKEEAARLKSMTNRTLSTGEESEKRAAALLAAVLGE